MGVTEERKETKFSEGGKGDGRHIYSYRFRGGKNSKKIANESVVSQKTALVLSKFRW